MDDHFNLDEILALNPNIDREALDLARAFLRQRRESGGQKKGYDLVTPYGGKRIHIQDDPESDPRLIRLRSRLP